MLSLKGHDVVVYEKKQMGMQGASLLNQARIHGGYHYPRSLSTAARCQLHYNRFVQEFSQSITTKSNSIYAIARSSKVSPEKFVQMARMVNAPIRLSKPSIRNLFNIDHIAEVYEVEETFFNSNIVYQTLLEKIQGKVELNFGVEISAINKKVTKSVNKFSISSTNKDQIFELVDLCINTTYGELNFTSQTQITEGLQFEVCELLKVETPTILEDLAITVVDGPYFSLTPWPALETHLLTHVRFTPHSRHQTFEAAQRRVSENIIESRGELAIRDASKYLTVARNLRVKGSSYIVKTVPSRRDFDDARPILSRVDNGVLTLIGSKFDNIYDIEESLTNFMKGQNH